jgi:type III pantothenate kinase
MKLLVDIGNTRIKSALLSGDELLQHHAIEHAGLSSEQLQSQVLQRYGAVESVWIANVAGVEVVDRIRQAVQRLWQLDATIVTATAIHGQVRSAYPQPEKLGVDRWLCLLATHAMHTTAQVNLIVSVGTAMTLDVLSADGQHRGGLIVPGPDLMVSSLLKDTSDIAAFAASGEVTDAFFADNTVGAIHQGAAHACAALIEAAYRKLAINESLKVIISGGAAWRVMPVLGIPVLEFSDLVLRGLAVMATN